MKKIYKITSTLLLPFVLLLAGCQDPVFEKVRKDVKPETATVSGNIGQITRFTINGEEYLFLSANEGLRYKKASNTEHGSWAKAALPFDLLHYNYDGSSMDGYQITNVCANSTNLYLFTIQYETASYEGTTNPKGSANGNHEFTIWTSTNPTDRDSWDIVNYTIPFPCVYDKTNDVYKTYYSVFQTNAPLTDNRFVYVSTYENDSFTCYRLEGTANPVKEQNPDVVDGKSTDQLFSAAYFKDGVKFFTAKAATTDETFTSPANNLYYSNGKSLYYINKDTYPNKTNTYTSSEAISALAATKDSILIGLGDLKSTSDDDGGIERVLLDSDGKPTGKAYFESNADAQISSLYVVLALLNATPGETERNSSLYAAISYIGTQGYAGNRGLWSYYPDRDNWNRE